MVRIGMHLRFTSLPFAFACSAAGVSFLKGRALWHEPIATDEAAALSGLVMDDERGFVVLVDFIAPVLVYLHGSLEPVEAYLSTDGDVVNAHGLSVFFDFKVVLHTSAYHLRLCLITTGPAHLVGRLRKIAQEDSLNFRSYCKLPRNIFRTRQEAITSLSLPP